MKRGGLCSKKSQPSLFCAVKRSHKYLGIDNHPRCERLLGKPGQAIVNNSALQMLVKQSPAGIDVVAKTFCSRKRNLLLSRCG